MHITFKRIIALILALFLFTGCTDKNGKPKEVVQTLSLEEVPDYEEEPFIGINDYVPFFTEEEKEKGKNSFEFYSELDELGRCGVAYASIGTDILPTEERGSISSVHPSGWHTYEFDVVPGKYLYNRCHLIAYCLSGENANEKNLITGTRYMNTMGMLSFEQPIVAYVEETGNHVLYRVTPFYDGDNLIASGVQIEAWSVEDDGADICVNVYSYNVQPGVTIDYKTGEAWKINVVKRINRIITNK